MNALSFYLRWHFCHQSSLICPLENWSWEKRTQNKWNLITQALSGLKLVCLCAWIGRAPVWFYMSLAVRACMCVWTFAVASENATNVHEWKQWGTPSNAAGWEDNSSFQLFPIYFIAASLSSHPALDEKHRCVKKLKWKSFWNQQDR